MDGIQGLVFATQAVDGRILAGQARQERADEVVIRGGEIGSWLIHGDGGFCCCWWW